MPKTRKEKHEYYCSSSSSTDHSQSDSNEAVVKKEPEFKSTKKQDSTSQNIMAYIDLTGDSPKRSAKHKSSTKTKRLCALKASDLIKQQQGNHGTSNEMKTKIIESCKMHRKSSPIKEKSPRKIKVVQLLKNEEKLKNAEQDTKQVCARPKIRILHANKDSNTAKMPDTTNDKTICDAIAPLKLFLAWDPTTVPETSNKKRSCKKKKIFREIQTQTQNGETCTERPLNADKLVKSALNEFFQTLSNKFIEDSKDVPQNIPYVYWPSQHGGLSVPLNPQQHSLQKCRMQINNKARVPTGDKQHQCFKVSSTSNEDPEISAAKPLVPVGAVEAQPLWRREDVRRLGNFKDRYDFPKKKKYVIDRALLDEEDRRMLELNELEKQKAEIERLRREAELFGDPMSDDDDRLSVASSADASFSDDNENPTETMQSAEQSAMIEERILNTIDDPIICELLDKVQVPTTKKVEERQPKVKKLKTKKSKKEDDAISLCASSFDTLTSDSEERMKDFEEEPPMKQQIEKSPITLTKPSKKQQEESSPISVSAEEIEKETLDPITAPLEPSFTYLNGIRSYFCPKFLKQGKCGYPCSFDLLCAKRLKEISVDSMKNELKNLDPSQLIAIFKFVSASFPCFNAFFPPLSSAMGINKLVKELLCAIRVCEKPKFEITYYKWVVDGLIRAQLPPAKAIEILIQKKMINTPMANMTLLDIVLKNNLLTEHIDALLECTEMDSINFEADTAERIIHQLLQNKMRNGSDIVMKVLERMTDVEILYLHDIPHIDDWIEELSQYDDDDDENARIESQPAEDIESSPENDF